MAKSKYFPIDTAKMFSKDIGPESVAAITSLDDAFPKSDVLPVPYFQAMSVRGPGDTFWYLIELPKMNARFAVPHSKEGWEDAQRISNALLRSDAVAEVIAALRWYEQQARDCRKIHSEGDAARQELDKDGGQRARAALAKLGGDNG